MSVQVTGFELEGIEARPVVVEAVSGDDAVSSLARSTVKGVDGHLARELQLAADAGAGSRRGVRVQVLPGDGGGREKGRRLHLGGAVAMAAWGARLDRPENPMAGWGVCADVSLAGELRPVGGVFLAAEAAKRLSLKGLVVARGSGQEAAAVPGMRVVAARTIAEAMEHVLADRELHEPWRCPTPSDLVDFEDVAGNAPARRAMEIAAAGDHSILLVGPPGAGKTMLARRLDTIMPSMSLEEAAEVTRIFSSAGLGNRDGGLIRERPFRAPHHTVSAAGLVGGGTFERPGEASLAHRGVLFLDEVTEFHPQAIEALRSSIRDGRVELMRSGRSVVYPASFTLVGARQACPCGGHGPCRCSANERQMFERRSASRLKGLFTLSAAVEYAPRDAPRGEASAVIRARVAGARHFRRAWSGFAEHRRAELESKLGRAVVGVAWTIASLASSPEIAPAHIEEAVALCGPERGLGMGMAR